MDSSITWQRLSYANSSYMRGAIEELHHAALNLAALGHSFLPRAEENGQWGMRWSYSLQALLSRTIHLNLPVRLALLYPSFELRFVDAQEHALASLKLDGLSQPKVNAWLMQSLAYLGNRGQRLRKIEDFSLPRHPLDSGSPFRKPSSGSLEELARYRHNAVMILTEFAGHFERPGSVRTWPQPFETRVQIPVGIDPERSEGKALVLGLGVSDGKGKDCYFYVRPAGEKPVRIPAYEEFPALPGGKWSPKENLQALLSIDEVLEAESASEQYELTRSFFRTAINACLRFMQEGTRVLR